VFSAATVYGARPTNHLTADNGLKQKGKQKAVGSARECFAHVFVDRDHSRPHSTRTANASVTFVTSM
jgi:hypothetical protein